MREYDGARDNRIRETGLSTLWLVDTASGFDVEHEYASDASFTVATNLSALQLSQFARDEQA